MVIKDDETDILWFLPLSTKVSKYRKIREHKLKRYGKCTTILIVKIAKKEQAILIQKDSPTILKYVDTFHMIDNVPVHVTSTLKKEIEYNFKETLIAHNNGTKLFYSDIDKFKKIMLDELEKDKILI